MLAIALHVADISHPWRNLEAHEEWSLRLREELCRQGDVELARGMPVCRRARGSGGWGRLTHTCCGVPRCPPCAPVPAARTWAPSPHPKRPLLRPLYNLSCRNSRYTCQPWVRPCSRAWTGRSRTGARPRQALAPGRVRPEWLLFVVGQQRATWAPPFVCHTRDDVPGNAKPAPSRENAALLASWELCWREDPGHGGPVEPRLLFRGGHTGMRLFFLVGVCGA